MPRLLIATSNQGKLLELRALLRSLDVALIKPAAVDVQLSVEEDGQTYAENARKKAAAFAAASGLATLADDSGLEVDALDGAPGIHSARHGSPNQRTDADRRARLLQDLRGESRPWTARFRAVVAISVPKGETWTAEGDCKGEIIPDERGTAGFGYDPIFLVRGTGRTMAELSLEEKNRLSHRARAITALLPTLNRVLDSL